MIRKIAGVILAFFCLQTIAQRNDSSPYSSMGIGSEVEAKTVEEMSMGSVGTASNSYQLSFSNPASYAGLIITNYTIAGENRAYNFKDDNAKDNSSNAYLSYLAMGIPMGDRGGFAFGLNLNSTIGYEIQSQDVNEEGDVTRAAKFEGNGGTNRVFFGAGYEVFEGFSLGGEVEYYFGKAEKTVTEQLRDINLGTRYYSNGRLDGFGFRVGAMYKKELNGGITVAAGTTVSLENELEADTQEYLYSIDLSELRPRDTILDREAKGMYTTPLKTAIGLHVGNSNKWGVSADYSFRKPIELSGSFGNYNPEFQYESYSKVAVGGFLIPKYNSISSYWDRISYRVGVKYVKTGLMTTGSDTPGSLTSINDFGISFGFGMPIGREYSKLNTSFEFGSRGTTDNGLTKENYFNFRLAIEFGSKWFRKYEIN
ncbi:hypothetical protein KH5_15980 [Urechidicola sp. KH5]